MMDMAVEDVPTKYGMLLLISWVTNMVGTMQMINHANIPVFAGKSRRLYKEANFVYVVTDQYSPKNYPLYEIEEYKVFSFYKLMNIIKILYLHKSLLNIFILSQAKYGICTLMDPPPKKKQGQE